MNELLTMEKLIQSIEEDFDLTKKRTITKIKSFFKEGNQSSPQTNMTLKFRNKISKTILTGDKIKGQGDTLIEVVLVDDPTGNVIDDGPEASARVQIVLLNGDADASDWTAEEFNDDIIPEMEGKQHLLAGNVTLKLERGISIVDNIRLRHHAIKIRPSVFKIGARSVDAFEGVCIKEAKTESFTVKDFRNKYYKKHKVPSPSDEVSRLVNIRKGGKIDKRLQHNHITTVEHFLIRHLVDPDELKTIVNLGAKKWEATVKNARACPAGSRMYCYINFERKIGVVFNVVGDVLGLYLESHYCPTSMLSEEHKAVAQELLVCAYENWPNVKPFDDLNSAQQHLIDSLKPEMVGSMFAMENVYDAFMQCSPFDMETMFLGFDDDLQQIDSCNRWINGEEPRGVTLVESDAVQSSRDGPKRWKKLMCVSRWFSVRKRVSVDITCNRKKPKIG